MTGADGRHDFDFFFGTWHGAIRKLADTTDRHCTEWVELEAVCDCAPILGGLGNFETATMRPGGAGAIDGATLRMFEPATGLWRIWWMSTRRPGVLDPPVAGRFDGGRGVFEGPDDFDGSRSWSASSGTSSTPTGSGGRSAFPGTTEPPGTTSTGPPCGPGRGVAALLARIPPRRRGRPPHCTRGGRGQGIAPKSTSFVATVPAVRPGAACEAQ
jgi:hypothetical protein